MVTLDDQGEVDFSKVRNQNVISILKKQESLVKVTLMQADLEFEYPQKLEKLLVKSDLLRWLDEEEEKLKSNATESILLMDQQSSLFGQAAATIDLSKDKTLTYEDYYEIDDFVVGSTNRNKKQAGKIPFEEFVSKTASENIFDNDVSLSSFFNFFSQLLE